MLPKEELPSPAGYEEPDYDPDERSPDPVNDNEEQLESDDWIPQEDAMMEAAV